MNPQEILVQALALLIQKIGYSNNAGKEVFLSDEMIAGLSPHGQLQVDRHPERPGYVVRYFHNRTIESDAQPGPILPEEIPTNTESL